MNPLDLQLEFSGCTFIQPFHELDQVRCEIFVSISYLIFLEEKIYLSDQLLWIPIVHFLVRLSEEMPLHQLTTDLAESHGIFNKNGKTLDIIP